MSRSVIMAIAVAVLSAAAAAGCYLRASQLRTEAGWLMARGNAAADEYAQSFDGAAADAQLASFDQRRAVLEQAQRWQRLQMVLVLAAVVSAFCSYVFFLFRRLREQLVDATADLDEDEQRFDPKLTAMVGSSRH